MSTELRRHGRTTCRWCNARLDDGRPLTDVTGEHQTWRWDSVQLRRGAVVETPMPYHAECWDAQVRQHAESVARHELERCSEEAEDAEWRRGFEERGSA